MKRGLKDLDINGLTDGDISVALTAPMKRGLKEPSSLLSRYLADGCTHCPDEKGTESTYHLRVRCTHCPDEKGTESIVPD